MPAPIHRYILQRLEQRKAENNFRSLRIAPPLVDFCSNDYLGFAHDDELKKRIEAEVAAHPDAGIGSTGSRLLSGNSQYALDLETFIASFHHAEAALLFGSGFDANYGLLSALPYRGDTVIYDELIHASVHDGLRCSKADGVAFRHNDLEHLEQKLHAARGLKYVVVESVYSMDGDLAPLRDIATLCEQHEAGLIVDEAHATGIFGHHGAGRVAELGLEQSCLARIHTFGKALGCAGAAVAGSEDLISFLVNYARPFIYSTAPSFHHLAAIKCAYDYLREADDRRSHLLRLADFFAANFRSRDDCRHIAGRSPVRSVIMSGNRPVKEFAGRLQEQGYDVRPIVYPTVAKGEERIRICLHSYNTEQETAGLLQAINTPYATLTT